MSKILAVFGATGNQGGSVINHVLNDPSLSQQFKIRAITRDPDSTNSKTLSTKVSVTRGDITNLASLSLALKDVHTVFAITTPSFGPHALETEITAGKNIADACVAADVKYLIFSTLPSITTLSAGKCTQVTPFDAKAAVEAYIRTLPIYSAFVAGGFFMENFHAQPFLAPKKLADGTFELARPALASTLSPYLDATRDLGKFVGKILAAPEEYQRKVVYAAQDMYSFEDVAGILSRVSGKKVVFRQVERAEFEEGLPEFLRGLFGEALAGLGEFGYFGPRTEELVRDGREGVEGLRGLEEYLGEFPVVLE